MSESSRGRSLGLDLMKAFGIYLVIFYHCFRVDVNFLENNSLIPVFNYFLMTSLSCCVPIFFFVNGAILMNKDVNILLHARKVIKIIVLTLTWSVITIALKAGIRQESLSAKEFTEILITFKQGWTNHLWFLQALVVIYAFYPLLRSAFKFEIKSYYYVLAIIMIVSFGNVFIFHLASALQCLVGKNIISHEVNLFGAFNPFRGIYGYSLGYFMIGGLATACSGKYNLRTTLFIAMTAMVVSTVALALIGVAISQNSSKIYDTVWNGYASIFTLINVVSLYYITKRASLPSGVAKIVNVVGSNTLGIYFIHVLLLSALNTFLMPPSETLGFVSNGLLALLILVASIGLCLSLKRIPGVKLLFSL